MKKLNEEGQAVADAAPSTEWSFDRLAGAAERARSRTPPAGPTVGPLHAVWAVITRAEQLCEDSRTLVEGELEQLTRELEAYGCGEAPGLAEGRR